MGLLSLIGLGKRGTTEVYCQSCGTDITSQGGDVSSTGRIYCHGYKGDTGNRCLDAELFIQMQRRQTPAVVLFNYESAKEVQEEIRKRRLKEFGRLEGPVEHPTLITIARSGS